MHGSTDIHDRRSAIGHRRSDLNSHRSLRPKIQIKAHGIFASTRNIEISADHIRAGQGQCDRRIRFLRHDTHRRSARERGQQAKVIRGQRDVMLKRPSPEKEARICHHRPAEHISCFDRQAEFFKSNPVYIRIAKTGLRNIVKPHRVRHPCQIDSRRNGISRIIESTSNDKCGNLARAVGILHPDDNIGAADHQGTQRIVPELINTVIGCQAKIRDRT